MVARTSMRQVLVPWVGVVLLMGQAGSAPAQIRHAKFQHLTIDDGLSQGSVNWVLQDRTGFLWFATADGLNRYDGRGMRVYRNRQDDPASLSNNFVRHLVETGDGTFWIATKDGLNRFDPATETFTSFHHDPDDSTSLSSDNIMRVLPDRSGRIWVGTWGGGLNEFDPATGTARAYDLFLEGHELARGNIVNTLHQSPDGTLWVAAVTGLFSRAPGSDRFLRHDLADPGYDGERDTIVIGIHEDADGILWLGTYTGLVRYDPATRLRRHWPLFPEDPRSVAANQVREILPDTREGAPVLWLATAGRGLARFDPADETLRFFTHDPGNPESLAHNSIRVLFLDDTGTLWVGTDGQGVDRLTPMATRFPQVADLPGDRSVWSFCEDRSGALWVGTGRGLIRQGPGEETWQEIPHRPGDPTSLGAGSVNAILEDRSGRLWFATASAGLARLESPAPPPDGRFRFTTYRHDPEDPASLSANRLLSLLEDRDGRLWVGTVDEGVDVLDPTTATFVHHRPDRENPRTLSDNSIECLYQDAGGTLWLGTLSGGLNRLDPGSTDFVRYARVPGDDRSLSDNHVTCVLEDGTGRLWVATANGLNRLDRTTSAFTRYFAAEGLPSEYIYGLLRDDAGFLWMGTNHGLARFDPAREEFRNFTVRDGLQSNEFNAGAFHRSPRGELFFGGHNGFNRFFPGEIRDNPHRPPVVLTEFRVLGEPAETDRPIHLLESATLSHRDYFCSFEFAALDYWAPEQNRYQYRLEGLDEDWIDAGTRNFVSYTNLAPGDYVFRVRGANADGVWSETGASLALVVTPPFWQRAWFVALLVATVVLAALGLHRYRVNRLLEIERLRTRISADLHDEIATNLSSIAMYSGMIEEGGERTGQLLERLRHLAEESVGSIRDIIWALNPTTETLHGLLLRLQDHLVPICRGKGIDLRVAVPGEGALPDRNLAPEVRHHLWLLLKETVNNALKHSDCTRLEVTAGYEGGRLQVAVADDGRGFDPGGSYDGHGLGSMAMRAEQLRGRLRIDSTPGQGTSVQLEVAV